MTSKLKSETARINGAKSKGPKTPEGHAKSARNSIQHGLTTVSTILLACESEDEFNELLAAFVAMHRPATAAEKDAVEQMAVARWRSRRIGIVEAAVVDAEMVRRKPETEKEFPGADPGVHLGLAIKALSDESHSLALFSRYRTREERTYDRAYRTLRDLQADRKSQQPERQLQQPESEDQSPETDNPAPAGEPTPTSEIRNPKSDRRHPKSPSEPSPCPKARVRNPKFQNEPTMRSGRRRFCSRHALLYRPMASLRSVNNTKNAWAHILPSSRGILAY